MNVRPERTFEQFSRGLELVRAIRRMWFVHSCPPRPTNREINANIQAIVERFDLTVKEWHYWCRIARTS